MRSFLLGGLWGGSGLGLTPNVAPGWRGENAPGGKGTRFSFSESAINQKALANGNVTRGTVRVKARMCKPWRAGRPSYFPSSKRFQGTFEAQTTAPPRQYVAAVKPAGG
jgi:hypothetical protein